MLRVIGEDWQLKILSLLLAVGLWFFVASAERIEIALAVPIEYVGLEGPLTLNGPRRESVDVQLQATRWAGEHVSPGTVGQRVGLALPDSVSIVDRRTVDVTVDIRPEGAMQQRAAGSKR